MGQAILLFIRKPKNALIIFSLLTVILIYLVIINSYRFKSLSFMHEQKLAEYPEKERQKFRKLINSIEALGFSVVITSAVRANGNDPHTRKHAMDINIYDANGKQYGMNTPKADWLATGVPELAIKQNFRWGGNFKTPYMYNGTLRQAYDPVHFDLEIK